MGVSGEQRVRAWFAVGDGAGMVVAVPVPWPDLLSRFPSGGGSVQVFRQRDPSFLRILHEMREGRVTEAAREVLGEKVMASSQPGSGVAGSGGLRRAHGLIRGRDGPEKWIKPTSDVPGEVELGGGGKALSPTPGFQLAFTLTRV